MAEPTEIVDLENYLATRGTTKSTPISVELHTQLRHDQDKDPTSSSNFVDLSKPDNDDVVMLENTRRQFRRRALSFYLERGESSGAAAAKQERSTFLCSICYEHYSAEDQGFRVPRCNHLHCKGCTARYVAAKLQDNIIKITCPVSGCMGSLEAENCASMLPREVFERWCIALCEAAVLASEKYFYCPFNDCSALLINDGCGEGVVPVQEAECPNCHRLFCARCEVPWHSGIECKQFQKLNKDEREKEDIMLMKLAEQKRWRRCPNCGIVVEKIVGCEFMRCRCGSYFCYDCGTVKKSTDNHYCTCKR